MKEDIFRFGIKNEFRSKFSWYNIRKMFRDKSTLKITAIIIVCAVFLLLGMLIPWPSCPECQQCQECAVCAQCPACDCSGQELIVNNYVCYDGTVVSDNADCKPPEEIKKYVCGDGTIVDNAGGCVQKLTIDTPYEAQDNHLLLAVDNIEFEKKGDDWGTITKISYAVKNFIETPVLPEIRVMVYNESDDDNIKTEVRHTIKFNRTFEEDDFVQAAEDVYISFKGTNITVKFVLVNALDEVQLAKVMLERPLEGG